MPAGTVLVTSGVLSRCDIGWVNSLNPRLDFITLLNWLNDEIGFDTWNRESRVASSASLGRNVVVEDGCIVGPNSIVEHNVVCTPEPELALTVGFGLAHQSVGMALDLKGQ